MCQKSCPVAHLNAHILADFNLEHVSILNIPWSKSEVFFEQILTIFRNFDQKVTFWKSKIEHVMLIWTQFLKRAPHFINFLCKNQNLDNMVNFWIFFWSKFLKIAKICSKKTSLIDQGIFKIDTCTKLKSARIRAFECATGQDFCQTHLLKSFYQNP